MSPLHRRVGPSVGRPRAADDDGQRQLPTALALLSDGPVGAAAGADPRR
ncbi:hypothetical protein [Streptomyces sp. NPDC058545]